MAIIIPYRPNASAKMRIKIIPTNTASCWAFALTPASPTIPIASPAAYTLDKNLLKREKFMDFNGLTNDETPQHNPEAKCLYPS